ncbi:ABC transporter permease subunit [Affinibrenneria salicis]|uniref:ABC transporter permease subunit n=1 Tax=Affinibrenneria salicis TaxID=2590031 RepID=A0A5J5G1M5_9GAMM|nr:ABC transporter permease subunit [Affinibrenneria salicis]
MIIDISFIFETIIEVLPAVPMTLFITATSIFIGFFLSLFIVYVNYFNIPILSPCIKLYVSFFRGTPMVLHIFLFFLWFPSYF